MTMLSKLEEAIKELERQKDELLEKIQKAGWVDDRLNFPIPAGRTFKDQFRSMQLTPERRTLPSDIMYFYQNWYSSSYAIIAKNQSDRLPEFKDLYTQEGYCIKYFLERLFIDKEDQFRLMDLINSQFGILAATPKYLEFSMYDIELTVYSVLMDDEIDAAKYLLKNGFLRAAGALAGVTLERHLKNLLRKHTPPIKYSSKATLATVNDLCKDIIYDTIVWRKAQHLTDLRNLCDHDKDREPTKDEVRELIDGVSAFLKNHPTP